MAGPRRVSVSLDNHHFTPPMASRVALGRVVSNEVTIFVALGALESQYGACDPAQYSWLQPSYPLSKWVAHWAVGCMPIWHYELT